MYKNVACLFTRSLLPSLYLLVHLVEYLCMYVDIYCMSIYMYVNAVCVRVYILLFSVCGDYAMVASITEVCHAHESMNSRQMQ